MTANDADRSWRFIETDVKWPWGEPVMDSPMSAYWALVGEFVAWPRMTLWTN